MGCVHLAIGLCFGIGLSVSGMLDQEKVKSFLDLSGFGGGTDCGGGSGNDDMRGGLTESGKRCGWDPSLAFVMGGGLAISTWAHWQAKWSGSPILAQPLLRAPDSTFYCASPPPSAANNANPNAPTWRDPKLVVGAVFFGIGWALGGVCPGPGLTGGLVYPFTAAGSKGAAGLPLFLITYTAGVWIADMFKAVISSGDFLEIEPLPSTAPGGDGFKINVKAGQVTPGPIAAVP
jgi:uncharacterized membrane protein YedE/YeeE